MRFVVADEVFEGLPEACFGVVIARNADNSRPRAEVAELLTASIALVEAKTAGARAKETAEILPYREAFARLGINPNKFMSSIEAMATRIEKRKGFPSINPLVDLGNAVSLKYLVPLGAHDMDAAAGDIHVRFSAAGDRFVPFGEEQEEVLDAGELIYSVGDRVKTRRWIWRQSEHGKVTEASRNVFFPIDGFAGASAARVLAARDELAGLLRSVFGCATAVGWVDKDNRVMEV